VRALRAVRRSAAPTRGVGHAEVRAALAAGRGANAAILEARKPKIA